MTNNRALIIAAFVGANVLAFGGAVAMGYDIFGVSDIDAFATVKTNSMPFYDITLGPNINYTTPDSLIIIGAGVSSINLAYTLLKEDPGMKITILEQGYWIGGRMHHHDMDGVTIEKGPNWVEGASTANPTYNLA